MRRYTDFPQAKLLYFSKYYINKVFKAYKFRLYPTAEQQKFLLNQFGACRFVWNYFLDKRNKMYVEKGKTMTYNMMSAELKKLKHTKEYEWLNEANAQSLQQALMHLDAAFQRFFKKNARYPNFKKKKGTQSFAVHFKINGNRLFIPKLE